MDAIIAITYNVIKACDLETKLGTLEKGKRAGIILVDGDSLHDIRGLQDKNKIQLIMKEGLKSIG